MSLCVWNWIFKEKPLMNTQRTDAELCTLWVKDCNYFSSRKKRVPFPVANDGLLRHDVTSSKNQKREKMATWMGIFVRGMLNYVTQKKTGFSLFSFGVGGGDLLQRLGSVIIMTMIINGDHSYFSASNEMNRDSHHLFR